jgi:2-methylcitrate dehydratase PrpD
MARTLIEQLADFAGDSVFERLPAEVVDQSKRILLDSVGCALAAIDQPKGAIGIEYGRLTGGTNGDATIIGTRTKASIFGAAFANGELINALDFDSVLPPGHVAPYVLPGILAVGEASHVSGKALLLAIAVSHEMSYRLGKAVDYLRDTKDGKVSPPQIYGYSSTIFGATAGIAMLKGWSRSVLSNALGIAGSISPVNSQGAWFQHAPSSTIKYLHAGTLTQSAMTAAHMAQLGHRGDLQLLDDREYGYAKFIGTRRWEPERIVAGIGEEWLFPQELSFKPYPHCRILHALLDALGEVVEKNEIRADEIDSIKAYGEGFVKQPVWLNRKIEHVHDAQYSIAHGLAVGALGLPSGKAWQDPKVVFADTTLGLMDKISYDVHPDYVTKLSANSASRPSRIELSARGRTFVADRQYPRGARTPDPTTYMTDEELIAKFRRNAEGVLSAGGTSAIIDLTLRAESLDDVSAVIGLFARDC